MSEEARNCREYCRNARYCYEKGEAGMDPEDCVRNWKIEDLLMDARMEEMDERRRREEREADGWEE